MPLPDLSIAPHEMDDLAPDEPPIAPATRRVRVWHPRWGGRYLVRRVAITGQSASHVLVARHESRPDAPLLSLWSDDLPRAATMIFKGEFARLLQFDVQGGLLSTFNAQHLRLYIVSYRPTLWYTPGGDTMGQFYWQGLKRERFLSSRWMATTTALQIEHEVAQMLADASSDCAFAWNWAQISQRERFERVCCTKRGTLAECEHLIRAVLWNEAIFPDTSERDYEAIIGLEQSPPSSLLKIKSLVNSNNFWNLQQPPDPSPECLRLLQLVLEGCQFQPNSQFEDKTTIREIWQSEDSGGCYWFIPIPVPTQHERLEARLQLREWLSDKVSGDEIDLLLR